jgi:hypothetical protein
MPYIGPTHVHVIESIPGCHECIFRLYFATGILEKNEPIGEEHKGNNGS